jgi:hypothetical protein
MPKNLEHGEIIDIELWEGRRRPDPLPRFALECPNAAVSLPKIAIPAKHKSAFISVAVGPLDHG